MVLDLEWLDSGGLLIFLFDVLNQIRDDLVSDMIKMCSSLVCTYAIDKADVLKLAL